jgi:hypothetical protein
MRVFLPCWGEKHIHLLGQALVKSFLWTGNDVSGASWEVVTDSKESFLKIKESAQALNPKEVRAFIEPTIKYNAPSGLLKFLKETMKDCVSLKMPMLMATPDYIFGPRTIDAFRAIGSGNACVSLAHMRATPEILNHLENPSQAKLVDLGLKFAHKTWTDSEEWTNPGRTFYGGISWTRTGPSVIAVRHRLPAPFYVNFNETDISFFSKTHNHPHDHTFALWDHLWPQKLIDEGRLRYIGSSDIAVMVEVTGQEDNIPPINPYGKTNRDEYCNNLPHHHMQKQFIACFRGES